MAVALRFREDRIVRTEAPAELMPHLADGPVLLEANGQPVAVLLDVERYRELQAVYDWHRQLREERRAS